MGIALQFLITAKGCIYESKLAHIGLRFRNGIFYKFNLEKCQINHNILCTIIFKRMDKERPVTNVASAVVVAFWGCCAAWVPCFRCCVNNPYTSVR